MVVAQERKVVLHLLVGTPEEEQVGTPYIQRMEGQEGVGRLVEGVGWGGGQLAVIRASLEILGMGMGLVVVVVVELTQPQQQRAERQAVTALPAFL